MSDAWHQPVVPRCDSQEEPVSSLQGQLGSVLQWVVKALEAEEQTRPADALECYRKADCTVSLARTVTLPSISSTLQDALGCHSFVECDCDSGAVAEASLQAGLWPGSETSLQILDEVLHGLQSSYQLRIQELEAQSALHCNPMPLAIPAAAFSDSQQDVCLQLSPCDRVSRNAYQPCYAHNTQHEQQQQQPHKQQPQVVLLPHAAIMTQHGPLNSMQQQAAATGGMASTMQSAYQVMAGVAGVELAGDTQHEAASVAVDVLAQQCFRAVHGSLDDVAGLEGLKQDLRHAVLLPMKLPHLFTGLRAAPRTFLLYGPPGTGKTMVVEKVAAEAGMSLLCLPPSVLLSKWSGESEKTLRAAFQAARQHQPCALFFDEIDSLAPQRGGGTSGGDDAASRRLLTELLLQLNTLLAAPALGTQAAHVYVFAATNRLQDCDTALLRRFHRRIHVPLPDVTARAAYFKMTLSQPEMAHNLGGSPHSATDPAPDALAQLVELTEGYSCSDLCAVCKEAAMQPVKELMQAMQNGTTVSCSKTAPGSGGGFGAGSRSDREVGSEQSNGYGAQQLRLLTMQDFMHAVSSIKPAAAEQQAVSTL